MALYRRGLIYYCDITTSSGKRINRSLRTTDRVAAQEAHDKLKHDLWRIERLGEKPVMTWDQAAARWISEKDGKRSIMDDIAGLRRYDKHLSGRLLHEITADEIHHITRRITKGDTSYNRHLALVRAMLNRAVKHWQWIDKAPALILKAESKRRVRWLTHREAMRLLKELPEHLAAMVQFSLHTGLRKANVTGLRWADVDLGQRIVYVSGDDFKNGNDHAVPLNDSAAEAIRSQLGKHQEFVFTYQGKPIVQTNTKAWHKALQRAGIDDFRWHDLRHTWASWLAQAGTPMHVLQELGGWESAQMLRKYAHLSRGNLAEYVGKLHDTNSPTLELERKRG